MVRPSSPGALWCGGAAALGPEALAGGGPWPGSLGQEPWKPLSHWGVGPQALGPEKCLAELLALGPRHPWPGGHWSGGGVRGSGKGALA